MNGFTVDPEKMKKVGNDLDSYADEFDSSRKGLLDEATTMGENYRSDDNTKFVGQIEELCEELARFKTKLETAAETLRSQANLYLQQEEENVGLAGQLGTSV